VSSIRVLESRTLRAPSYSIRSLPRSRAEAGSDSRSCIVPSRHTTES